MIASSRAITLPSRASDDDTPGELTFHFSYRHLRYSRMYRLMRRYVMTIGRLWDVG
ncbi:hypothetical protein FAIPA1_50219 [Frankia sp. AiPs1]